jgi:hypothetical protein
MEVTEVKRYKEFELDLEICICEHCGAEYIGSQGIYPSSVPGAERCIECVNQVIFFNPYNNELIDSYQKI